MTAPADHLSIRKMLEQLERDYANMAAMIFGPIPVSEEVVQTLTKLERPLNEPGSPMLESTG